MCKKIDDDNKTFEEKGDDDRPWGKSANNFVNTIICLRNPINEWRLRYHRRISI